MRKDSVPECQENGRKANIQDDTLTGVCGIQAKRVDRIWANWEYEEAKCQNQGSGTTRDVIASRSVIIDAAHGGITGEKSFDSKFDRC